jgi:hypothetical protein
LRWRRHPAAGNRRALDRQQRVKMRVKTTAKKRAPTMARARPVRARSRGEPCNRSRRGSPPALPAQTPPATRECCRSPARRPAARTPRSARSTWTRSQRHQQLWLKPLRQAGVRFPTERIRR